MKRGVPERGDILHLNLNPVLGKEQRGERYVLVLTLAPFNRFGLALVAPVTQGGGFAREHGLRFHSVAPARKRKAWCYVTKCGCWTIGNVAPRLLRPCPRILLKKCWPG